MKFNVNPGELLVDVVAAAIKKIRNRPGAVARRARKAARKAVRVGPLPDDSGEFFQPDEVTTMLEGKKTWIGLALLVAGIVLNAFGVGDCSQDAIATATCVPADTILAQLGEAADKLTVGFGLLFTAGGTVHKQIREKRLKAKLNGG